MGGADLLLPQSMCCRGKRGRGSVCVDVWVWL